MGRLKRFRCVAVPERYTEHRPPSHREVRDYTAKLPPKVVEEFAYSSWISINAENKENTDLFDSLIAAESGRF